MSLKLRAAWRDLGETADLYAARDGISKLEVVIADPGLRALAWFRLAHALYLAGWQPQARWMSRHAARVTGIKIHPGARIGRHCMFLEGGHCLIGETAVLGDDCKLQPGTVLVSAGLSATEAAPTSWNAGLGPPRVHPTVGHRVTLEAGASLVGDIFIGNDVRVLAGAVITRDIPDGAIGLGVPGRVVTKPQSRPDPDARAIKAIAERFYRLEEQVQVVAFTLQRQQEPHDRWRTHNPPEYGPIEAVEALIDGAGI